MALDTIRPKRFSGKTRKLLEAIKPIIAEYEEKGISLTLRALYYQLVSRQVFSNQQTNYFLLSRLLTDARYAGVVDWEIITDHHRSTEKPSCFDDLQDGLSSLCAQYRRDKWANQPIYLEVQCEKDALYAVISPLTSKCGVALTINRGYTSATAIYGCAQRFKAAKQQGKVCVLLYVGDHDPSGLNMSQDIRNRLAEMGAEVEVVRVALNFEQVKQFGLPPNPVKAKDTRSADYSQKYGVECWEVDALKPEQLVAMIRGEIEQRFDKNLHKATEELEVEDRKKLRGIIAQLGGV